MIHDPYLARQITHGRLPHRRQGWRTVHVDAVIVYAAQRGSVVVLVLRVKVGGPEGGGGGTVVIIHGRVCGFRCYRGIQWVQRFSG